MSFWSTEQRMDFMADLLNIAIISSSFLVLLLVVPLFYFFKFLFSPIIAIFRRGETLTGKVVLITGASSGIGEALAYEYAKRGARLALVARREDRLRAVLDKALRLGAPDGIIIPADVSNILDAQHFVAKTIDHFGQLDHLVNNAGASQVKLFQEFAVNLSDLAPVMDVNFWGSVYATHFAVPHLRKSRGKIVVISSSIGWLPSPKLSFYCASKAALISFFETLRAEFGSEIGINIVGPGFIKTEMTTDEYMAQVDAKTMPIEPVETCAEAIVNSTCRGDLYLIEPSWFRTLIWFKWFFPGLTEWLFHYRLKRSN
ncbi:11-beta-hydroxysteroid dehydrogenase-like 4A isoform X2 [Neltuma alba]|uniref:11-beta-hydroxysteroid dehydrogenase-like 4A isoform X2 n=1 Tax=Neltuma alba TaxID=207710 RepID=UPI0010A48A0F|nr:11-beta-hydroxysteroid dehydrogenase-like 4A isoform X2 [Prosopis alba]